MFIRACSSTHLVRIYGIHSSMCSSFGLIPLLLFYLLKDKLSIGEKVFLEDFHDQGVVQGRRGGQRLLLRGEEHCQDAPGRCAADHVENLSTVMKNKKNDDDER